MSSIVEDYRVSNETVQDTFATRPSRLPEDDDFVDHPLNPGPDNGNFVPKSSIINKADDSPEDKAWSELVDSLGQRVKDSNQATHEITVYTGGASAIKVKVVGFADPEAVNAAKAQEDAVTDEPATLPPPAGITDQVDAIRKYNTDQYMKHSKLNPKKFG